MLLIYFDNWFQTRWRNCAIQSGFHASVLLIDKELRHNIVKVAVDPRVNNRTDARIADVSLFFCNNKSSNCPHKLTIHVSFCLLTMKISQWARENFRSYCKIVHCCRWLNWTDLESPNMVRSLDWGSWDVVMWAKVPNSFSALTLSSAVTW